MSVNTTIASSGAVTGLGLTNGSGLPCIGFTGSGFMIFYYVGVTGVLRSLGLISDSTKLAGTSSSAIHTVSLCSGTNTTDQFYGYRELAHTCRPAAGCRGFLDAAVTQELEKYLPSDAAQRCSGRLYLAVTQAKPGGLPDTPLMLGPSWSDRQQVLSAVRASSYIPVQSGQAATFELKMQQQPLQTYDGGFSVSVPQPPDMGSCLKVASIAKPENTTPANGAAQWSTNLALLLAASSRLLQLNSSSNPASAPYLPLNPLPRPLVLPDIFPGLSGPLLVPAQLWNSWGLAVPTDAALHYMFDVGRHDAAYWAVENRLATPAEAIEALGNTTIAG